VPCQRDLKVHKRNYGNDSNRSQNDEGWRKSPIPEHISRSPNVRTLNRVQDTCGSRCKPVPFAIVMRSRKKACGPEFSFPALK
jgi:hypothetical protein